MLRLRRDAVLDPEGAHPILDEMARRMSHTGREQVETFIDAKHGLAIARVGLAHLSPIAWPGMHEPPSSPTREERKVFLDGIVHGDVEVRRRALEEHGGAALADVEGFFSAAIWEPAARRLTLAAGRRAARTLVYAVVDDTLYFAPELKALRAVPGLPTDLDPAAVGVFLGAGHLLAHQTLFAAVRRLAGGERLVAEPGHHRVEKYWSYTLDARGDGTKEGELVDELAEIVRASVERNYTDPSRTVVFLSGGVDSRAIAAVARDVAKRVDSPMSTVTWACPDPLPNSDVEVAGKIALAVGAHHRVFSRETARYHENFWAVSYLLDGLNDLPAYHPHEHTVMRTLAAEGAHAVLRGDECFGGWGGPVGSIEDALFAINLRPLGALSVAPGLVREGAWGRFCEASADAIDEVARGLDGAHPDDARDMLYFNHRLQGYLNAAAYYKQVVLDHRSPLLDEAVLAFNQRVPARLRSEKTLFQRAAAKIGPDLFALPLATHHNLEDWAALLASPSHVRRHVEHELADASSGIWDYFDREALAAALPKISEKSGPTLGGTIKRRAKQVARAALHVVPEVERRVVARLHRPAIRTDQILLRALVLKCFHDLFVEGDGSRSALARKLEASPLLRVA